MGMLALRKKIDAKLQQGTARQTVFQELAGEDSSQAMKYAFAIATIPKKPIAEKFLMANTVLLFALLCLPVLTFISALPIDLSSPTIFLVIQLVVPLVCLYFVFEYHGAIYRIAGLWFLVDFTEAILKFQQDSLVESFRILCLFVIVTLSFYMARKLFPHLKVLGIRKGVDGNYQL